MGSDDLATDRLLCQARNGDGVAVGALFARHRDRLRRMVAVWMDARLKARIDASDVIQDAMAEAARKLPDYLDERPCAFYPWLRQIAWKHLVTLHRRHVSAQRRSVTREAPADLYPSNESTILFAERFAASSTSIPGRLVRKELHQRVQHALERLAPGDREVVVLLSLEQLSLAEVADVLGVSVEAARSRYRRAIERLHQQLTNGSEKLP